MYKYVLFVRHGQLDNPADIVYTRDSEMKPGDIIHLTAHGKEQMRQLGELILKKSFEHITLTYSPETRTKESAMALNEVLTLPGKSLHEENDLDEIYAPGPYHLGMTIHELMKQKGNAYTDYYYKNFHHETPEQIITRMIRIYTKYVKTMRLDETTILLSHGDPLAWLINEIALRYGFIDRLPHPGELRLPHFLQEYPAKGEAIVAILDNSNKVIKLSPLSGHKKTQTY